MKTISRDEARNLIENEDDLTVVEVLDEEYFKKFHLPDAHNVPLDGAFTENIQRVAPNLESPVLVYCMDADCEASPKAGELMEEIGYTQVFDYEAGKADWKEAGYPIEETVTSSS